jgi:hypothetical protein
MIKQSTKNYKITMLLFMFFIFTGYCFAADPAEGFWLTIDQKTGRAVAGWHFYTEGGIVYAKLLSLNDESDGMSANRNRSASPNAPAPREDVPRPEIGTPWIYWDTMVKSGEWRNGKFINAESSRNLNIKLIFRPADRRRYQTDTLELRVEIGLGIGRSQFLQRSDEQTARSL